MSLNPGKEVRQPNIIGRSDYKVTDMPFVTIIVPCRNEEKYISLCLNSLILNDYLKDKMEILVIDGLSSDNTEKIIREYEHQYKFIRLLSNKKKIFPVAVNIGVSEAIGEFVLIAGSHARYNPDYIKKCVDACLRYNVDNAGGILITEPQAENLISDLVTFVLSSPFGVGNSTFRTGSDQVKEVDTVFGGCYRKDIFIKIGGFNENLISTSDLDFNRRLRKAGGKILLIPDIKAYYYTRSTLGSFLRNNLRNGYWAVFPMAYLNYVPVSFRHLVPLFFIMSLLCTTAISFFLRESFYIGLIILIAYLITALLFSLRKGNAFHVIILPIFYFLLHITYGLGSLYGLVKIPLQRYKIRNIDVINK